ncbi:hypothetical protein I546_1294 [Mycobacterium kansasii 732]|nr:hypothetical protein I546_1294 [Mycobacterium kansasii 732]
MLSPPPATVLAQLDAGLVTATIVGGEIAYTSGPDCPRA